MRKRLTLDLPIGVPLRRPPIRIFVLFAPPLHVSTAATNGFACSKLGFGFAVTRFFLSMVGTLNFFCKAKRFREGL